MDATGWLSQLHPLAWLVLVPVLALLWLLWVLVPFAVFGIKGRLDRLSAQLGEIREELARLNGRLGQPPAAPPRAGPPGEAPRPPGAPAITLRAEQDDRVL